LPTVRTPAAEPFERFAALYLQAQAAQPKDPNACVLASVDEHGRPSARVVLLKGTDARGFVVYTNHQSRKGQELLGSGLAALCFHWPALDVQVRVEGAVEVVTDAEADAYFATRARASQLGAWASLQSQPLDARETLLKRFAELEAKYQGLAVPRPPHWGGFRLVPDRLEFWKAGDNRLHHREQYRRDASGWEKVLLYP
jgi:pyridoxamine 5'-phosphate oxidase